MTRFLKIAAVCLLLPGCFPQRSFVGDPYEPVTVQKKGDVQLGVGTRSFRYYNANATIAVNNYMAARASLGGFFNLGVYTGSLIFFKNYNKAGFFAAPLLSYQQNLRSGSIDRFFINHDKTYQYNCRYLSPGLAVGFKLHGGEVEHHFNLKTQYNFVKHYSYYYTENNGSGSESNFQMLDNENVNTLLPPFFSFEPSYVLLEHFDNHSSFKLQIGFSFCQKVLRDEYSFKGGQRDYQPDVQKVTWHPLSLGFGMSAAYVFTGNRHRHNTPK